jgi:hypothetical protein
MDAIMSTKLGPGATEQLSSECCYPVFKASGKWEKNTLFSATKKPACDVPTALSH